MIPYVNKLQLINLLPLKTAMHSGGETEYYLNKDIILNHMYYKTPHLVTVEPYSIELKKKCQ